MTSRWSNLRSRPLAALAASVALFTASAKAEPSSDAVEHILRSDALTVRVMDPNSPQRYNQGPRFSPVAAVLQVSLDERDFLYCPEPHDPLLDGAGLFGEFDILTKGGPPGFTETRIGEGFLKIGVGVIQKESETYDFFAVTKILERAKTSVEWTERKASFRQSSQGVNGYAYVLEAEIVVKGSRVSLHWALSNTGTKAFSTEHYVHNFFLLGSKPVGPGYQLEFSHPIQPVIENGSDREGITWKEAQISFDTTIKNHVNILLEESQKTGAWIEVSQRETGEKITVDSSAPVARTSIHATSRYLCPEQFVRITLQPGESYRWRRHYDFSPGKNRE